MTEHTTSSQRSAHATVKGFLAQAIRTVGLWLDLAQGELLVCEGIEDADLIKGIESLHHQFKEQGGPQSVFDLRGVIAAFAKGFADAEEDGRNARFVLVSSAELRSVKSSKAGVEHLLRDWRELAPVDFENTLKQLFSTWNPTPARNISEKARFDAAAVRVDGLTDGWRRFQMSVTWEFDATSFEEVELALAERLQQDARVGGLADVALGRLLHEVLRASSQADSGDRRLTADGANKVIANLHSSGREHWTAVLLKEVDRVAYEKALGSARRKISGLLTECSSAVSRTRLDHQLTEALAGTGRVLVTGRRGMGKSRLVAGHLAARRVIWVDAASLGPTSLDVEKAVPPESLTRLAKDGGCLVIDGLEIADQSRLREVRSIALTSTCEVVATVRSTTRVLDRDVELALPNVVVVDVPELDDAEVDELCLLEGIPAPSSLRRQLLRTPFFFWLARTLRMRDLSSEREMLEQHWSEREVTADEAVCLEGLARGMLENRSREALIETRDRAVKRSLIDKGFIVEGSHNSDVVRFSHDVLLDFAIARHVLQRLYPLMRLVAWLRDVDVVRRSWCLPSIAFEAERFFANDVAGYWRVACEVSDTDVVIDWIVPARSATDTDRGPLIRLLQDGDTRALSVLLRLSTGAAS